MLPDMAVGETNNYHRYEGNNSLTCHYEITFRFDDSSWLRVERVDADGKATPLTEGCDFELTYDEEADMTLLTTPKKPIPCTSEIVITRHTPALQEMVLVPNAPLPAKALEKTLDWIVLALQDRDANPQAIFSKALVFPMVEPVDHNTVLPLPHLRKNSVLYFDSASGNMRTLPMVELADKIAALIGVLGPRGPMGYRGPDGYRGPEGYRGPYGYQGPSGGSGARGPMGIIGPQGFIGPEGPTGPTGPHGPRGPQGYRGEKGYRGDRGEKGYPGDRGEKGYPGDRGEKGYRGDRGEKGYPGDRGEKGYPGDRGEKGYPGDRGEKGYPGDRGEKGYPGDRGEKGYPGEPGEPGADGADGTCECTCYSA